MWVKYVNIVTLLVTSALARVAFDTKLDEIDNTISDADSKAPVLLVNTPAPVTIDVKNQTEGNSTNSDSVNNVVESMKSDPPNKIDNGTALILTPYIKKGKLKEARKLSKVDPEPFLGVESYSGFMTVNETFNSNLFFWYFPVVDKPVNETPWIIWLQGGPGASSLVGLFDEFGPFRVVNNKLQKNPLTWLRNHSLLFIDSPVGAGYSFTNNASGFVSDINTYSDHLYRTVQQFLQIFPELRTAPLYVAGESYAGKYVPGLGVALHRHREEPGMDVNLQGFMIGNAFVSPEVIKYLPEPMLYLGILQQDQLDYIKPLMDSFRADIKNKNSIQAKQKWTTLITILLTLTNLSHAYNFLSDTLPLGRYVTFLRQSEVKRALHVGDINYDYVNLTVNANMAKDFLTDTQPLFEELLENYRVMAYCGQLDLILPCVMTSRNQARWQWSAADSFRNATRLSYMLDNKLAGFVKSGGNFTEVVIRGAGHMVPMDQPYVARDLITKFIANQPLVKPNPNLDFVKIVVDYFKKHEKVNV